MIASKKRNQPGLNGLAREAKRQFKKLFSNFSNISLTTQTLDDIRDILKRLVLNTTEFDVATKRIKNAKRYLRSSETGAAKYEIGLLLGGLRTHLFVENEPDANSGLGAKVEFASSNCRELPTISSTAANSAN